jgi:hypothetical protein
VCRYCRCYRRGGVQAQTRPGEYESPLPPEKKDAAARTLDSVRILALDFGGRGALLVGEGRALGEGEGGGGREVAAEVMDEATDEGAE